MQSNQVSVGQSGLAAQYNNLRDDAYGGSILRPHQQGTPIMTLYVEPGSYFINGPLVKFGGGNTPSFTAPVTHPRIDIVTLDASGTVAITQGTEASSPVTPAYPANKIVICEVYNVVGETAIYTTNAAAYGWTSSQGYIQNDSRSILQFVQNPTAIASDLDPDATDTRSLGSSGNEWLNIYGKNVYTNGALVAASKFGGTGADGALTITSGTTTINCSNAAVVVKNYTSISITGSGNLAFSNPNSKGTIVILKSQGNVTITSSATAAIDMSGMGAAGGSGGGGGSNNNGYGGGGAGGASILNSGAAGTNSTGTSGGNSGGASGTSGIGFFNITTLGGGGGTPSGAVTASAGGVTPNFEIANMIPYSKAIALAPGGGGGQGGYSYSGNISQQGSVGGSGGGGLYIECAGYYDFTGIMSVAGLAGTSEASGTFSGGCGGGGGGGTIIVLYNSLTANSGTYTVAGGAGGTNSGYGGSGTAGGAGTSLVALNTEFS